MSQIWKTMPVIGEVTTKPITNNGQLICQSQKYNIVQIANINGVKCFITNQTYDNKNEPLVIVDFLCDKIKIGEQNLTYNYTSSNYAHYLSYGVNKKSFLEIVANDSQSSKNWVLNRMNKGGSYEDLALAYANKGKILKLVNGKIYQTWVVKHYRRNSK